MQRRLFIQQVGLGVGGVVLAEQGASADPTVPSNQSAQLQPAVRPKFIWDNREDEIYHELISIADEFTGNDPRYYAFYNKAWTFNRSMAWSRIDDTIIAHQAAGDLMLTGTAQQSAWFTGPDNTFQSEGSSSHFTKKSHGRHIDCAVLPMFQYHLGQHPVMELSVSEASADWQFCISLKGRAGPPFICSGWQRGAKTLRFDVTQWLRKLGYEKNYAEVHFIIGTWTEKPDAAADLQFSLRGEAQPAVVACLPIIRTVKAAASGVLVSALLTDAPGNSVRIAPRPSATIDGKAWPMQEQEGIWRVTLQGLKMGDHAVTVSAAGFAPSTQWVRVTDGEFFYYDKKVNFARKPNRRFEPLSGSYEGVFFVKDAGSKSEQLILGQTAWDQWDREGGASERAHGWESLTPAELDEYFTYLAKCGWDLLHLHQYWGNWERLDAFGNIAPHGAEQLALYLRTAGRHQLASIQALSSYAYNTRRAEAQLWYGTIPWQQTLDAGFRDDEWLVPQPGAFQTAFHRYLTDFVTLFRDETALFALSASGEGDHTNGLPRSNDVFHFVRSLDHNHIFYAEAILGADALSDKLIEGWNQDYLGSRTYTFGELYDNDLDLGVYFKLCKMANNLVMAEGAWPPGNLYTQFLAGRGKQMAKSGNGYKVPIDSIIGTSEYRTQVRDTLYLGMTNRMQIMMTWDEKITEDERIIFHEARSLVDWVQPFQGTNIAVLGHDDNVSNPKRGVYGQYEKAFRGLGLNYRIVSDRMRPFPPDWIIYDSSQFEAPEYLSAGGRIPDSLRATIPLTVQTGYFASWCWSEDRRTLLAYFYNVSHHIEKTYFIAPKFHRIPNEVPFEFTLTFPPAAATNYRLYDLNDKRVIRQGAATGLQSLSLVRTTHDFLLVIVP